MYNKPMLSLSQCQVAIDAMVADFNKDPNRRQVDMAIVDDMGNLLVYARMDEDGGATEIEVVGGNGALGK